MKRVLLTPLLLATAACTSTVEPMVGPRSDVTLLVTNSTCDAGQCTPIHILGFPDNQPGTPGGAWSIDLGLLTGLSVCLTLPASREFHVTEYPSGAVTIFKWSTAQGFALGSQQSSESPLMATPSTGEFVPASESAWSVTLPGTGPVSPASTCIP
jgi:hypothetical protein